MELKGLGAVGHVQPVLPANYGQWSGAAGNSNWVYDLTAQRWDMATGTLSTWGAMIARTLFPMRPKRLLQTVSRIFPRHRDADLPGRSGLVRAVYLSLRAAAQRQPGPEYEHGGLVGGKSLSLHRGFGHIHALGKPFYLARDGRPAPHHSGALGDPRQRAPQRGHRGGERGGIGARKNDFSDLENRRFGGELLYRMGNTWVTKEHAAGRRRAARGGVYLYLRRPRRGACGQQRGTRQALEQRWEALAEEVWPSVAAYVQSLDTEAAQGGGWQAAPQEIIVYPPDLKGMWRPAYCMSSAVTGSTASACACGR